jgi:hypothetical protein
MRNCLSSKSDDKYRSGSGKQPATESNFDFFVSDGSKRQYSMSLRAIRQSAESVAIYAEFEVFAKSCMRALKKCESLIALCDVGR